MGDVGAAFRRLEERLYAAACAAMLVFGIVVGLPGTLVGLPDVVAEFDLSLADRGALISTLFFGMLLGCVIGGPVVDQVGQRRALAASTAVAGVSLLVLASVSTLAAGGLSLAVAGFGCSGMNISANALSSDLFPAERARRLNRIGAMAAVGGLCMPAATAVVSALVSWRAVVAGAGAVALLVAAIASRVASPPRPKVGATWADAGRRTLRQPGFVSLSVLVLLGAANETTMSGWTSTYLSVSGASAGTATWILASHWLGLILGRSVQSARQSRPQFGVIVVCALAGAAITAAFVFVPSYAVLVTAPFGIGAAIGIIVPTSLALGGERLGGNAGTLFGLLLTFAQIGGMLLPAVVGAVADRWDIRAGLSLMVVNGLLIAAVAWRAGRR